MPCDERPTRRSSVRASCIVRVFRIRPDRLRDTAGKTVEILDDDELDSTIVAFSFKNRDIRCRVIDHRRAREEVLTNELVRLLLLVTITPPERRTRSAAQPARSARLRNGCQQFASTSSKISRYKVLIIGSAIPGGNSDPVRYH